MKQEQLLVMRVANYLKVHHTSVPYRFDQIDQLSMQNGKKNKELHGKWSRGYPDLFIAKCTKRYGGLYLELKATVTVHDTEHTRRQAAYHAVLRECGYKVKFVCGYDEAVKAIDKYLKKEKK